MGSPDSNQKTKLPFKIPYPQDAGIFSIKHGDVIMTRPMYDFLVLAINMMPGFSHDELRQVCDQLVHDLGELVK